MELILTGDSISGAEFERLGVVNKVFPKQEVLNEAIKLATRIAALSGPVIGAARQAVLTGAYRLCYAMITQILTPRLTEVNSGKYALGHRNGSREGTVLLDIWHP